VKAAALDAGAPQVPILADVEERDAIAVTKKATGQIIIL
jgi:hypothetical protein